MCVSQEDSSKNVLPLHGIMTDKSGFNFIAIMKRYIRRAIILYVICILGNACIDLVFDELKTPGHYAIAGLVFTILVMLLDYFDSKGWNSWSKLFGKKNRENK